MENQNERPGYQFAGWYIDEERKKRINPGGKLPFTVTLYDKWIPILFPVAYELHGGVNSRKNPIFVSVESGARKLYPARKPGQRFDTWLLEGKPVSILPEHIDHTVTLEACFAPLFEISFESNGGGRIAPKKANEDNHLEPFNPPMKLGCTFAGWYLDPELNWPFDFSQPVTQDMTLYARWNDSASPVEYDTGGGMNSRRNPKRYDFSDTSIPLYPARKKGFRFVGWYDGRGNKLEAIPPRHLGPLKLTARWRPVKSHHFEQNED